MNIQLSDHFTYKKLFRFVLPSIVMMIFTSIYSVVDGLFVGFYQRFKGRLVPLPCLSDQFLFFRLHGYSVRRAAAEKVTREPCFSVVCNLFAHSASNRAEIAKKESETF